MNPDVLQSLRDVHLPPEPSWWPPSWHLTLVILAIALVIIVDATLYFSGRKHRKLKKWLREEVLSSQKQYLEAPDKTRLQSQIGALIRRVLIYKFPQKSVAALAFADLGDELKKLFPRSKKLDVFMELVTKDRFHKDPDIDASLLINLALEHFKKCRL